MRRIPVDHARRRQAGKRGCAINALPLEDALTVPVRQDLDIVALDESLTRLAAFDQRKSQIVEMRFFAGLSVKDMSEALQIPPAVVRKEWMIAKAWLYHDMAAEGEG